MRTGTALFFGLVLVVIVILYHSTKDRWNWKKITKKTLLVPVGLIAISLLIWLYFVIEEKIQNMPTKQVILEGIKLGDSREDVLFQKGEDDLARLSKLSDKELMDIARSHGALPAGFVLDSKIKKNKTGNNSFSDIPEGFEVVSAPQENNKNADILHYGNLQIFFENDKVSYIRKTCVDSLDSSSVNGIMCGNSLKDIESKLGKTEFVECSKDFLTRIYSFPKYQSAYLLTQNSVIDIAIYDSSTGKRLTDQNSFSACSSKN